MFSGLDCREQGVVEPKTKIERGCLLVSEKQLAMGIDSFIEPVTERLNVEANWMSPVRGEMKRSYLESGAEFLGEAEDHRMTMPTRFWLILVLSLLGGIAVVLATPTGRKAKSSVPWRGQIKPPPPPP